MSVEELSPQGTSKRDLAAAVSRELKNHEEVIDLEEKGTLPDGSVEVHFQYEDRERTPEVEYRNGELQTGQAKVYDRGTATVDKDNNLF